MNGRLVILSEDDLTVIDEDGNLSVSRLPPLGDSCINRFFEILDCLPKGIGFLLDRQTGNARIFEVADALRFDVGKGRFSEFLAGNGMAENARRKVLKSARQQHKPGYAGEEVPLAPSRRRGSIH
jgi:hypothetical protein